MASRKRAWSDKQQKLLFELHQQFGNKWSVIATRIADKDDSSIKNKFYSTLRKGLRKMNKREPAKFKAIKTLEELFLTKVTAIVDENYSQKYQVKPKAIELALSIQQRIVTIAFNDEQYVKFETKEYEQQEQLLADIQQFNRNCKKRKGKRRVTKGRDIDSQNLASEEDNNIESLLKQIQSQPLSSQKEEYDKIQFNSPDGIRNQCCSSKINEQCNANTYKKVEQKQSSNNLPFVPILQKLQTLEIKDRSSFEVFSNTFTNRAEDFFKNFEENSQLNQSANYSLSNSFSYQMMASAQLGRQMSGYFTQQSPLVGAAPSPFDLNNLMKNKNVTGSNMYDKSVSLDLFSSGKISPAKNQQHIMSLVDDLPLFKGNSLFKSADLIQSVEISGELQQNMANKDGQTQPIKNPNADRLNQFLSTSNHPNCLSQNEILMKNYTFDSNIEMMSNSKIISEQEMPIQNPENPIHQNNDV